MYTCAITQNEIIELVGDNIHSQIQTQMGDHEDFFFLNTTKSWG